MSFWFLATYLKTFGPNKKQKFPWWPVEMDDNWRETRTNVEGRGGRTEEISIIHPEPGVMN